MKTLRKKENYGRRLYIAVKRSNKIWSIGM